SHPPPPRNSRPVAVAPRNRPGRRAGEPAPRTPPASAYAETRPEAANPAADASPATRATAAPDTFVAADRSSNPPSTSNCRPARKPDARGQAGRGSDGIESGGGGTARVLRDHAELGLQPHPHRHLHVL